MSEMSSGLGGAVPDTESESTDKELPALQGLENDVDPTPDDPGDQPHGAADAARDLGDAAGGSRPPAAPMPDQAGTSESEAPGSAGR